jgi:hypothetical protein
MQDEVVTLRCGSRRCQGRVRLGEVFHGGQTVKRACDRGAGHGVWIARVSWPSLRLPCRCGADWNVAWDRLADGYQKTVQAGRRVLVLGVDL